MEYTKSESGSYVHNCYIKCRNNDKSNVLFWDSDGITQFCLNGYAIVPFEDVKSIYPDIFIDETSIEEADKQLKK